MTTATLTLTDFLLARIEDDEADCQKALAEVPDHGWASFVLTDCEAKRRIVGMYRPTAPPPLTAAAGLRTGGNGAISAVLHILALPYADHPDYREEWRP